MKRQSTKTQAELDLDTKLRRMAAAVFRDVVCMQRLLVRTRGEEPERDRIRKALEKAYRMGLGAKFTDPSEHCVICMKDRPAAHVEANHCPWCGATQPWTNSPKRVVR